MTVLVNLALFVVLGVLQVDSKVVTYEYKDMETEYGDYEVKCWEKTITLAEHNEKHRKIMKQDLIRKETTIKAGFEVIAASNECFGKESDKQKCLEEIVVPALTKFKNSLHDFRDNGLDRFTETLADFSLLISHIELEINCCFKSNLCIQKFEIPNSCYKRRIAQCKDEKYAMALSKLLCKMPGYMASLVNAKIMQEGVMFYSSELQKMKEYIPKDEKYNEEEGLTTFIKLFQYCAFYLKDLLAKQISLNPLSDTMIQATVKAITEILYYPTEKCSKQ